jgi:hypothetical protein
MTSVVDSPSAIFPVALVVLAGAAYIGDRLHRRARLVKKDEQADFDTALAATLTLLGLIIGFSFSMAVSRYDQRKNCEEAEANAIGTEYVRADLLQDADGTKLRELLRIYTDQRIAFYSGDRRPIGDADVAHAKLQKELWSVVARAAKAQPTPTNGLAVSGMNDVLNSQGYTQAAWLNRIPGAAWALMGLIAVFANFLMGYRERSTSMMALLVLPVIVSIAFFLIADIDSPRGGIIRVAPHNLIATSQFMATSQD